MLSRYLFYLRGHNKRNFSLLIFLLLFALLSSACGGGGSNDVQATLVALEETSAANNAEATNAANNAKATISALEVANVANNADATNAADNAKATITALEATNAANNAEATKAANKANATITALKAANAANNVDANIGADNAEATIIALETTKAANNVNATKAVNKANATITALKAANTANNAEATIIALEAANAANNAEATVSALEATIEAQNNSTPAPAAELDESPTPTVPTDNNNTSAQATQTNPTPPPLAPKNELFFDDFSNNNNGWSFTSDDNGSVQSVQQSLVLSGHQKSCVIAPLPNFKGDDEYYIESDVKVTNGGFIILGYAAGSGPLQYYKYGVVNYNYSSDWAILLFSPNNDVDNPLSTITLGGDRLWENDQTFALGMKALAGSYTLYLNGEELAGTQFKPEGNSVGLFACSMADNRSQEVRFDNLVVRQSR